MHKNAMQRLQILEILYLHFEESPKTPWVNEVKFKELGDMDFAVAAMKELGQIRQNGLNYCITGPGILVYEAGKTEK